MKTLIEAALGDVEAVQLLLESHAEVNAVDEGGCTALMRACACGKIAMPNSPCDGPDCVQLLIDAATMCRCHVWSSC